MTSRLDELFADLPVWLTPVQVADLFGVSTQGAYKWVRNGVIPAYKVGGSWMVLRDELRDVLEAGRNLGTYSAESTSPAEESEVKDE